MPSVGNLTIAKFERSAPLNVFSVEARGCGRSHGQTVTKPSPPGSATVTVNSAAAASFGTPPRPATRRWIVLCDCEAPYSHVSRSRVSRIRDGD